MGKANGVDGIDFLFTRFGEFFPDLASAGADMLPLFAAPPPPPPAFPPPDALLLLKELKDGETDLEDANLFEDNDEEIEDGIFKGFNLTVGVFLKLLLCKSAAFSPLAAASAGEVLAEEGAEREPELEEAVTFLLVDATETLGDDERPTD